MQKDALGDRHLLIDGYSHALFVDDVTRNQARTRDGEPAHLALRVLAAPHGADQSNGHDGNFLLDAKAVQQLHEMCSEILAGLSAEALK